MINKITILIILLITVTILYSQDNTQEEEPVNKVYVVDKVEFIYKDHQTLSPGQLSAVIVSLPGKAYDHDIMGMDIKRLKKFYFDNGFFDAIIDTNILYVDVEDWKEGEAIVQILVYERSHYRLKNIQYNGLDYVQANVKKLINKDKVIHENSFYSRTEILNESKRIVDILQNNGYYNSGLDTSEGIIVSKYFSTDPTKKNSVKLDLNFHGADKIYYFGSTRITIQDNKYDLRDHTVRKQLEYKEGEIFSREKVFQTERNFTKLQLIANGRLETDTILNDDRIDLEAIITLQNKYEITPSIGGVEIEGQFYLSGGIEYLNKNFLHHGGSLSLSINGYFNSGNNNRIEFVNKFTQPSLFNNRVTFSLEDRLGYYNLDVTQILGIKNLARFNYLIARHTFYQNALFDITIDFLRIKYKKNFKDEEGNVLFTAGTINNLLNSIVGVTIVHDRTNDLFNPSSGTYHSITVEEAGALARLLALLKKDLTFSQYVKIFIPNKYFMDLSSVSPSNSILAMKFQIGDIIEFGSGSNLVPIQSIYKFYSGGSNSLRGWVAKSNGMVEDPENGGKFLIDGSFEHRIKLFPNDPGFMKDLWGAYFIDYGNIWNSPNDFRLRDVAIAIGVGARYYTFIGPIRFDLGFKLYDPNVRKGEQFLFQKFSLSSKFAFQFGIGNPF